jgi:hypothetical protein
MKPQPVIADRRSAGQNAVMKRYFHLGILLGCLLCLPAYSAPLFDNDEQVSMSLAADFSTILNEKDKSKRYPARLSYQDENGSHGLDVELEVRGNFRLGHCQVPGLRVFIPKGADGLFEEQKKLKLVTQCRIKSSLYQDYLLQEYAIYKAYQALTPESFQTRLAMVDYLDTGKDKTWSNYGFFIEDIGKMGKRLGMKKVADNRISRKALVPASTNLASLYMYLVGNTDYSLLKGEGDEACCHNAKLLDTGEGFLPVPYDFDLAGMINASYAAPPVGLNIDKVTQRLYRGFCDNNEHLAANIALLNERKAAVYDVYADERIRPKSVKRMHKFLDRFYRIINDQKQLNRRVIGKCR